METIELVLRILLVIDALALIGLIMIQQGRGASMGAAFGSGASQTMFGSAGASSFLNSLTAWLAAAFFALTFALAWTARERAQELGTVGIPRIEQPAEAPGASEDAPSMEIPALDASSMSEDVPAMGSEDGGAALDEIPAPADAPAAESVDPAPDGA
ncbi:MAG: preprotein translocase subunit SecG [Pseudomonadales bacterium]|jgi:preprotein translocase subunit SecG|nr:preprotein translocase subunit SecG [Pseudomonadales bacterium]